MLLQRLGELAGALLLGLEQPCIFDGDHRLIGKCHNQFDLAVGEGLDPAAREPDSADRLPLAHQRDADHRAGAANPGVALFLVKRIRPGIVDAGNLPRQRGASNQSTVARQDDRLPFQLQVFRGVAMPRGKTIGSILQPENHRLVGAA